MVNVGSVDFNQFSLKKVDLMKNHELFLLIYLHHKLAKACRQSYPCFMGHKKMHDLMMIVIGICIMVGCQETRIDVEKDYKKNTNITDIQETAQTDKTESETKNFIKKPSLFEQIVVFPGNVSKSSKDAPVFPHLVEFETRITGGDGYPLMAESISPQKNGISFSRFDYDQGKIVTTTVDPLTGKEKTPDITSFANFAQTCDGTRYLFDYSKENEQLKLYDEQGKLIWSRYYHQAYRSSDKFDNCINVGDFLMLHSGRENWLVGIRDGKVKCKALNESRSVLVGQDTKFSVYENLIYQSFFKNYYYQRDGTKTRSVSIPVFYGQEDSFDESKPPNELTAFDVTKFQTVKPGLVTECLQTYPEGMAYFASGKPAWKKEWELEPEKSEIAKYLKPKACPYVNLSADLVLVWYGWGRIEALDRRNGDLAWFRDINAYTAKCSGEGNIIKIRYMETIDYNKDIYIARHLRLDAKSGKELASWTEENRYDGESHTFSKFNETNGKVIWKITFKERIKESVHINGVIAFLTVNNTGDWEQDFLYGIDDNTGKMLWKIPYRSTSYH